MIGKVFDFADTEVRQVMVPRPDVVLLPIGLGPQTRWSRCCGHPYTRYPVYDGDVDDIVGILHVRTLFGASQNGGAASSRPARADPARAHGARDQAPGRPARRVPAHQEPHGDRRRRVRLARGDRDARGSDRGDRGRHRRRVRPARDGDPAARARSPAHRGLVPDRGLQRALRARPADRRLHLDRRLRLRRARPRAAARRRGRLQPHPLRGRRRRRHAHPAGRLHARGRAPAGVRRRDDDSTSSRHRPRRAESSRGPGARGRRRARRRPRPRSRAPACRGGAAPKNDAPKTVRPPPCTLSPSGTYSVPSSPSRS